MAVAPGQPPGSGSERTGAPMSIANLSIGGLPRRQRTQPGKLRPAMLRYSGPAPSFVYRDCALM